MKEMWVNLMKAMSIVKEKIKPCENFKPDLFIYMKAAECMIDEMNGKYIEVERMLNDVLKGK